MQNNFLVCDQRRTQQAVFLVCFLFLFTTFGITLLPTCLFMSLIMIILSESGMIYRKCSVCKTGELSVLVF